MLSTFFIIATLSVFVTLLIRAELKFQRLLIYIFKPISTVLVISLAMMPLLRGNAISGYGTYIFIGLLFSLGGDLALMFPENKRAFTLGLGLFLLAHVVYTCAFLVHSTFILQMLTPYLVVGLISLGIFQRFRSGLGSMKKPVIAYFIIITLMVGSAFSLIGHTLLDQHQLTRILIGVCLFYISDVILAANRFWKPWKYNRFSLAFYYSGQALLALSTLSS